MKKYNLMYGHLGNGITVCNRNQEVNGDYKTIAHIDSNRNVKFYEELPKEIQEDILCFAKTQNPTVSATQDISVFKSDV